MKQKMIGLKVETVSSIVIIWDSIVTLNNKQNQTENKEGNRELNTINQLNLTNIYRPPYSAIYTYFSSTHGTFFRIDNMLDHKLSLNRFKKNSIPQSIFPDNNKIKLEINNKTQTWKFTNLWKWNSTL